MLNNSLENGDFALDKLFTPILEYILAEESWKQAIPITFDIGPILYLVVSAGSVAGFYFLLSSTNYINSFLPSYVKGNKWATILFASNLLPIIIYLYY